MMKFFFGTWKGRIIVLFVMILSFVISLTCVLAMSVKRGPETATAVSEVPVLGDFAMKLAEMLYGPATVQEPQEDVETIRTLRPLSSEEITALIEDLKHQRQVYLDQMAQVEQEQKRLELHRQDLARERDEIDKLRQSVAEQWDEIQKARATLNKEVTEIQSLEQSNLKQLATSYESMKPDKAAEIVKKLDETTAVKTLHLMKERNAAKIIENLDQETAARLSERLALVKLEN